MVGVVEGFRSVLLETTTNPVPLISVSSAIALLLLLIGSVYFRQTEKSFADVV
jgi:ABC-type polysaccharide/polyol phosphate export permease